MSVATMSFVEKSAPIVRSKNRPFQVFLNLFIGHRRKPAPDVRNLSNHLRRDIGLSPVEPFDPLRFR